MLGQQTLQICSRHGFPISLVYFDLNNFKPINDKFGHAEGDKVLINFARLLEHILRESDIVARVGGDEFVALIVDTTRTRAEKLIKRFQANIDEYNSTASLGYNVSFSHGIVEYCSYKHRNLKALMREGDVLMYERKRGKGATTRVNTAIPGK